MATTVSYLHPHMETRIVDNSTVVEQQSTDGTIAFMPYFSSRGVDGVIERYTSYAQFVSDKGLPNYKKHGQAIYNVLQFLRGNGVVYGIRLLPEDATRANVKLQAKILNGVVQKAIKSTDEDLKNDIDKLKLSAFTTEDVEDTGVSGDLLQVVCKGRGVYGNKYSVDLVFNTSLTESYGFAIYELTVKESGRVIEGPYFVSLQPEAVNLAGASMYIKNIIEEYSSSIAVIVNENLYDAAAEILGEDYASIDLLNIGSESISLELTNGSDGSKLDTKVKNPNDEDDDDFTIKDKLLVEAFSKQEMLSKTRYPIDILLDANFSVAVKEAINALGKSRGDVFTILDLGPDGVSSAEYAKQSKENLANIADDRCTAFYAQTFTVYDSFTNSDILVTMPYFLAYKIPANDGQYGIQYPIAGPNRGIISGFKSMSFNPTIDEKEELYKARINYAEQDYRNTKLMTQLTSQTAASALSNINNMRVLLRMVRNVEQIAEGYFFEFASSSTLSHFQQAVNSYLSTWVSNGACQVCQGTVYQNNYDVVQRIVRVSVEVVFTGLIERIVIEFNVGSNAN